MKHKIFENVRKLAAISLAVSSLLFASCGDVETDENTASFKNGQKVAVKIELAETARSAYPTIVRDEFLSLELRCDGKVIESWANDIEQNLSASQMMAFATVLLDVGEHEFVLTGKLDGGSIYKDTIKKTIAEGSVLSFKLALASLSESGTGNLSFTIFYPQDTNANKIIATRYPSEDGKTFDKSMGVKLAERTGAYSWASWTYSYLENAYPNNCKNIPAGLYVVVFDFYGGEKSDALIGSYESSIGIVKNKTTQLTETVTSYNKTYTITFNLNGGKIDKNEEFTQGYSLLSDVVLPEPAKEGLDFGGWFESENLNGTALDGWEAHSRVGDIELHAKWNYTVSFDKNAPEGAEVSGSVQSVSGTEGKAVVLTKNNFALEGYLFKGWNTVASPTEDEPGVLYEDCASFVGTAHTTLYAQWIERTAENIAVTFRANGGSLVDVQEIPSGTALTEPSTTRKGYEFVGWFTTEDFAEGTSVDFESFKPTKDTTLYAKWNPKVYNIEYFDYVAGSTDTKLSGDHETDYAQTHTHGTYTPLDTPTKTNFAFTGWHVLSENGELSEAIETLSGDDYTDDIKLYATWDQVYYFVTDYDSLTSAISSIEASNKAFDYTISVSGSIVGTTTIPETLTEPKSLTIYGKNNEADMLDGNAQGSVLTINTKVPVTLKNIAITNGTARDLAGGIHVNNKDTVVTLEEGTLIKDCINTSGRGGIDIRAGLVIMNEGAAITNNEASSGGAVSISSSNAKFIMNGGEIIGNKCQSYYGGNISNYGTFIMNGGKILSCTASYGGAVYINGSAAVFTMNGGEIQNCRATVYGGAVYMESGATFNMNGGKITACSSGNNGGSVYISGANSKFNMDGGTIENTKTGGAVYVNGGKFNISGSARIPQNEAETNFVIGYPTVTDVLTAESPVATVKRTLSEGYIVLAAGGDVTLTKEIKNQFAYFIDPDDTYWNIVIEGNYAYLRRPVYKITYKEQGGGEFQKTLLDENAPFTHTYGTKTTLPVPEREDYLFLGWYLDEPCESVRYKTLEAKDYTDDITVYAKWAKEQVLIKVISEDISVTESEGEEAGTIKLTPQTGYSEYTWSIDGEDAVDVIDGASVSDSDLSLTFAKSKLMTGRAYQIVLTAKNNNGKKFMTVISISK